MERRSLTFLTFKNISYNMIGYIWPMFFTLFITPVVIFRLGVKNYGIYLFVNAIIALFGLLDLGLATATTKHMSYYYGKGDTSSIRTLTHSANSLFFIIGCAGFLLSVAIAFLGPHILPTQFASYQQYAILFMIGGAIFFVTAASNTYTTILTALQRFDISNKIGIISLTASSLGILIVVLMGGSLTGMFLVQLLITTVTNTVIIFKARKILPEATFLFGWNKKEIKHCYRFGFVVFINGIASTALASLDRLIIPFYVGPSNLTYYSIPGSVTGKIPGISNTLGATMFPTTSQLDGSRDKQQIEILYVRSFRLITIAAAAFSVTSIAFAYKILLYWLNADFANHSSQILVILAFTNFILALFGPLSSFLLGLNKIKFLTAMSVTMGVLNAILLVILLPRYGITGAAWAYLISVLPVIYVFYYTEKTYLTLLGRKRYYIKKILGTLLVSSIVWLLDTYILSSLITNLITLLLIGTCSVMLYLILYKLLGFFDPTDWTDIEKFSKEILRKIKNPKIA